MNTWRKLMGSVQFILPNLIVAMVTTCTLPYPHLTSVTPNSGLRPQAGVADVRVTLDGENFIPFNGAVPTVDIDECSCGVTSDFYGPDPYGFNHIDLTLHIDANATLGAHTIAVTTRGGTTRPAAFYVTCQGCPPPPLLVNVFSPDNEQLIGGGPQVSFRFVGTNFLNNDPRVHVNDPEIIVDPTTPNVQQTGCPDNCTDYFDVGLKATRDIGWFNVAVTTTGGTTLAKQLTAFSSTPIPPPGAGPNLMQITPRHISKNSRVFIKCEGSGFGTHPSVIVETTHFSATSYLTHDPANQDQVVVAQLVLPFDGVDEPEVTVRVHNSDTNTTSNGQILYLDKIVAGTPYCYGRPDGIAQNGDRDMTITGQNLQGMTDQSFSGIPGLVFTQVHSAPDGNSVSFHVHGGDGTTLPPVTGDEANNLTITTTAHGTGNPWGFPILPAQ